MQGREVLSKIVSELEAGRSAALCVIVATRGSTPQSVGAMLCVDQDARITGTVGGGCAEADIRRVAHELLSSGKSRLMTVDMDQDFAADNGLICGGCMDVAICTFADESQTQVLRAAAELVENGKAATLPLRVMSDEGLVEYRVRIEEPPRLIIAGGGHIGRLLAEMMVPLGFTVHVLDDRIEFANADRLPPPINPVVGDIANTLRDWPIDSKTYVVIVTRGHKHDEQALAAILDSPAKYLGMIGSRRKIDIIFEGLKETGAKQEQLDRVHAPIGLPINSVTPEEIALSIAAELVATRRADRQPIVERRGN